MPDCAPLCLTASKSVTHVPQTENGRQTLASQAIICLTLKVCHIDHITVMMSVSAAGKIMPTFLIYEKNLPTLAVTDNLPAGWLHGVSPNGGISLIIYCFTTDT